MRNMSFRLTTSQFLDGSKVVTRRLGWSFAKPGLDVMAVKQAQGIKAGELERFGAIRFRSVRNEPLDRMIKEPRYGELECLREGFPDMTPKQFVEMFCDHQRILAADQVNRIWFRHLDLHQDVDECPKCFVLVHEFNKKGFGRYCPHCNYRLLRSRL